MALTSFTPTLTFSGNAAGMTYGTTYGGYQITGDMAEGFFVITLTNKGTSVGNAEIGLPVAVASPGSVTISFYDNLSLPSAAAPVGLPNPGTQYANLRGTGTSDATPILNQTHFTNSSVIYGTFSYPV